MGPFVFDVTQFRIDYPQFANSTTYPDGTLQNNWDTGSNFISTTDWGWLHGSSRLLALNLLTAHITMLADKINTGKVPSLKQAGGIGKINITLTPPPVQTQFRWWLNLTGYGQQLLTLLSVWSVGGWFVAGSCVLLGFKRGC